MLKKLFGLNIEIKQSKNEAFNLDTLLLADFMNIPKHVKHIVEVGTGNGVLLFYINDISTAKITGLEIQTKRFLTAVANVKRNHLDSKISILNMDFIDFQDPKVDMIISNPPFFKMSTKGHVSEDNERLIARFEVHLTLEAFIKKSGELLKHGGLLTFIHRPERLDEIMMLCTKYGFGIKRMRPVYPKKDRPCNHVLIEAHKGGKLGGVKIESPLIIYDENNKFTNEMNKVYKGEVPCY